MMSAINNSGLSKDSAAVKNLIKNLESGGVPGTEDPKQVLPLDPLFQRQKLPNFRTCFYNARAKRTTSNDTNVMFS